MNIENDILDLVKELVLIEEDTELDAETDLLTSGTIDSITLIRLVSAIETKYDIKISPVDLVIENFFNVQSMNSYVVKKLANK